MQTVTGHSNTKIHSFELVLLGGFGIGLGIGGAVATPLGNLAFGQGESLSFGK
jgi:hypothetical protein